MDEARTDDGALREPYAEVLPAIEGRDLPGLAEQASAAAARFGVHHGTRERRRVYAIDPVPRIFTAAEWRGLEAGLAQRVRALEAFVADVHGEQRAIEAGIVPREAVESCVWFEPVARGLPAPPFWIGVAGPDVVRDGEGRLVVLEDNVRTPTMMAYAVAARHVVDAALGEDAPAARPIREPLVAMLHGLLHAAAPAGEDPAVAILSDGDRSGVQWEVEALGPLLGVPVLEPHELEVHQGRLRVRASHAPVNVLWRRTSEERLLDDDGRPNALGFRLLGPLHAGNLRVVNAFGTGVADDKRIYPYVEDLVRFYTGDEPLLPSVRSYDLADAQQRQAALDRLDELVIKPRTGSGGFGVVVGPRVAPDQLAAARDAIAADPGAYIAQETVSISTHPTLVGGRLAPRHLDLRPFVFFDGRVVGVLAGGLSRFALEEGDLVVNSSQGGGGKDVRVLPDAAG